MLRWCEEYGFVREGVLREHEPDGKGGRRNVVVYSLLRPEHVAAKPLQAFSPP